MARPLKTKNPDRNGGASRWTSPSGIPMDQVAIRPNDVTILLPVVNFRE